MPRVLIFANDNTTIYNFRRELLQRLVSDGFEVTVALPADERNQAFRDLGCEVIDLRMSRFGANPFQELGSVLDSVRVIRQVRPDVVLTYTAKPNIYGGIAAQLCRVPYIGTVTGLGAAFQSDGMVQRISAALQRLAFRRARIVFFQNADNRSTFRRLSIVGDRAEVLPGSGVNLELHRFEPYQPDHGRTRFITVSRIRQDKGFDELFEVIRRVCAQRDDVEFHIVGWYEDESYRTTVEQMQAEHPVVVHGSVSQERVHELLAQSHCLIHPSHHEGMANVILEASATGLPSIASDIPGCRETIEHAVTGYLVDVRDTGALQAGIDRFLAQGWDSRRAMGAAARRKMEAEFDRDLVVDRYVREMRNASGVTRPEVQKQAKQEVGA